VARSPGAGDGAGAGGRGGAGARRCVLPLRGVGGHRQAAGVDAERGDAAVGGPGAPGEPGHGAQAHAEADRRGDERHGAVHHGEGPEQRHLEGPPGVAAAGEEGDGGGKMAN